MIKRTWADMPFILSPAEEVDCEAIVRLQFEACAEDPGFAVIFPHGSTPDSIAMFTQFYVNDVRDDPTCYIMKVTDKETGELASFAAWYFVPEKSHDQIEEEMLDDDVRLPSDANLEAGKLLIRNGHRKKHEILGGRAHAYLAAVGTSKKYRKQGGASLCLGWGTRLADEKALPGYVEGTPSGIGIYRKHGFEVVDRLKLELSPWNEGDFWNVCMIRPAKE